MSLLSMSSQLNPLLRDQHKNKSNVPSTTVVTTGNGMNHHNNKDYGTNGTSSTTTNSSNGKHDVVTATNSSRVSTTSSSVKLRPMGYLTSTERRNRYRCIIVMVIFCIATASTLLIWVCYIHHPTKILNHSSHLLYPYNNDYNNNNNYNSQQQQIHDTMQSIANNAIKNLNDSTYNNYTMNNETNDNTSNTCETTLLVIRHCDKVDTKHDDDDDVHTTSSSDTTDRHCSAVGFERASYITTLFGNDDHNNNVNNNETQQHRYPIPKHLFALSSDRGTYQNYREYETLYPLSQMIHVPVEIVDNDPYDTFATKYFFPLLQRNDNDICGTISIVSWKHHLIPQLVNSLGCGPNNGCPMYYPKDTFDQVWELKFVYNTHSSIDVSNELQQQQQQQQIVSMDYQTRLYSSTIHDDNSISSKSDTAVIVDPSVSSFHVRKKKKHHHHGHGHHHHRHRKSDIIQPISPWNGQTSNNNSISKIYWMVFGTVTYEMFDPLAYSKQLGNYP